MKKTTIKSVVEEADLNLIPGQNPPNTKVVVDDTIDLDLHLIAEARNMIDIESTEATEVDQEMIRVVKVEEARQEEAKNTTTKRLPDKLQKKEEL